MTDDDKIDTSDIPEAGEEFFKKAKLILPPTCIDKPDITIADVLKKVNDDLEWRGPNDKTLGHVVLARAQAAYLYQWAMLLIHERDEYRALLEWLNRKGGLGLDVHDRIKKTLGS